MCADTLVCGTFKKNMTVTSDYAREKNFREHANGLGSYIPAMFCSIDLDVCRIRKKIETIKSKGRRISKKWERKFHVLPVFPLPYISKHITLPFVSRILFLGKANSAKIHQSQLRSEISRVNIRFFFCQQVHHHVSVRQLRKQRFSGCSRVLGGLL